MGIGLAVVEGVVSDVTAGPGRILVTGNMGYVGPSVVGRLGSEGGAELVGFDAGYFAHVLTGARALPERALARQHFGDVRNPPPGLCADVDAVVHLAAMSNDPIGNEYEELTLEINHRASVELARLAKASGARSFVFASSCSVYGFSEEGVVSEESPTNPLTAYARSKWLTERDLEALADERFTVTSLRFGTACGMSPRLRLDLVLNDFAASAVASGKIVLLSDGTAWRPLIHVRDMARAVEWAVARDPDEAGSFLAVNVGSEEWNYRIRDLAEEVADVTGSDVSYAPGGDPDKRSYRVDFDRYRTLAPDHQPAVGLREAVEELRDGLVDMGFADPDFRASTFARLFVLRELRERGLLDERLRWAGTSRTHAAVP